MVEFVELEGAADAILIGFSDLVVWGFALESDEDGNVSLCLFGCLAPRWAGLLDRRGPSSHGRFRG